MSVRHSTPFEDLQAQPHRVASIRRRRFSDMDQLIRIADCDDVTPGRREVGHASVIRGDETRLLRGGQRRRHSRELFAERPDQTVDSRPESGRQFREFRRALHELFRQEAEGVGGGVYGEGRAVQSLVDQCRRQDSFDKRENPNPVPSALMRLALSPNPTDRFRPKRDSRFSLSEFAGGSRCRSG
jgi:hypothetical protein